MTARDQSKQRWKEHEAKSDRAERKRRLKENFSSINLEPDVIQINV